MKKKNLIFIISILCIALCATMVACNKDEGTKDLKKPEFDENGVFIEENFAYNMSLPKENGITLISGGKCDYQVVISQSATDRERRAAEYLAGAFEFISGKALTLVDDSVAVGEKEIVVGRTNRPYVPNIALKDVGAYMIFTKGQSIYIFADTEYGTSNGVYGFMEDYLGCMFLDVNSTYYPHLTDAILPAIDKVEEPAFEHRNMQEYAFEGNKAFRERLRATTDETFDSDGCHHSLDLIDKSILDEHPEYYALIGGQRRTDAYLFQGTQLCFSNPEVINLLEEAIMKKANSYSGDRVVWWDISQQDSMNRCECENCEKMIAEAGSAVAPMLNCVNTIAKRHPDVKFSTLAYHYGSTPPENITIEPNVMIKWCIMGAFGRNDYSKPLSEGTSDIAMKQYEEIVGWGKLTDNIYVWDYETNYFNYFQPFPCYYAMQGNMQLLRNSNVRGIFCLSSYNAPGDSGLLKAYLCSHLMWNPDIDFEKTMNKFLTVFYGNDAAPYIIEYYNKMQKYLAENEEELWVYDTPSTHGNGYLSEECVEEYRALVENAISATTDGTYLKRLEYHKMSVLYASVYNRYGDYKEDKKEFLALAEKFGIYRLNEVGSVTVDNF